MKDVFYVATGSVQWGLGHLRRSAILVRELRGRGLRVAAVAIAPGLTLSSHLSHILGQFDERIESISDLRTPLAVLAVVDSHPACQPEIAAWLKIHGSKAFALDWYTDRGGVVESAVNLIGGEDALRMAIVADEFLVAAKKRDTGKSGYDVVVVMGGGDFRNHLPRILKSLCGETASSGLRIAAVVGPLLDEAVKAEVKSFATIDVMVNPSNLAEVMSIAAVGMCNAGSTLLEFTAIGVPTIIFPQTEIEDRFSALFAKKGCSLMGELDPGKCARQLQRLLGDKTCLNEMSLRARELVDGLGKQRIADEVESLLQQRSGH